MSDYRKNRLDLTREELSALRAEIDAGKSALQQHEWMRFSKDPEMFAEYEAAAKFIEIRDEEYNKKLHEVGLLNAEVRADMGSTIWSKLGAPGKGFNVSAADLAGAPVDFTNWALRKGTFGMYDVEAPWFGSAHLRRNLAASGMGYQNIGDLPPSERPGAVFGEVVGSATATAFPVAKVAGGLNPMKAAAMEGRALTGSTLPNVGRQMVQEAYKRPGAFATTEGFLAGSSAWGGAMAEALDPGNPMSRFAGELTSPLLASSIRAQASFLRNLPAVETSRVFIRSKLPGGAEREAASNIREHLMKKGENPDEIVDALGDYNGKLTPAQYLAMIGKRSEGLLDIEKTLVGLDAKVSKAFAEQTKEGFDELDDLVKIAAGTGDVQFLRIASELRFSAHVNSMQASKERILKQRDAAIARADLQGGKADVKKMKAAASRKAKAELDKMYEKYKAEENRLWENIPKQVPLDGMGVKAAMEKLRGEGRLRGITYRPGFGDYNKWRKRWKEGKTITSQEMLLQRRAFLRAARRTDDGDLANVYKTLANGILDDLETIPGDAVKYANAWTRGLRHTYDQPVVQTAMVPTGPTGAPKFHEGAALGKALGSDVELNIELIRKAVHGTDFAKGDKHGDLAVVDSALQSFLHAMAKNTMTVGGKVDEAALGKFLQTNADALEQFGLKRLLTDAYEKQRLVNKFEATAKQAEKTWKESEYHKLLDTTKSLDDVVGGALFNDPARLKALRQVARDSDTPMEAYEGLKTSVMSNLYKRAVYTPSESPYKGLVSGYKTQAILESKMGAKTLREYLLESGTLREKDLDNIDAFSKELMRFEDSLSAGGAIEGLGGSKPSMMSDAIAGLLGAEVMTRSMLGKNINHSIQVANIGAKVGRELISKSPTSAVRDKMITAMLSPEALKIMLRKRNTPLPTRGDRFKMNLYLVEAGLMSEADAYEEEAKVYDATVGGVRLDSAIETLLEEGVGSRRPQGRVRLTPKQVMKRFEREAYEEDTDIGPYALDYVQTYLELSNEERAQIQKELKASHPRLEGRTYTLKRR